MEEEEEEEEEEESDEEEEGEFNTSGNWREKHDSLEEGQGFRPQGEFKHAEDIILATLEFLKLQMVTDMSHVSTVRTPESIIKTDPLSCVTQLRSFNGQNCSTTLLYPRISCDPSSFLPHLCLWCPPKLAPGQE